MAVPVSRKKFEAFLESGDEESALSLLKTYEGNYYDEVAFGKEGEFDYKIINSEKKLNNFKDCREERCIVTCAVKLSDKIIRQKNFRNWYFLGDVDFAKKDFIPETSFYKSLFYRNVEFCRANFKEVDFNKTVFYNSVNFYEAKFKEKADFSRVEFKGDVSFSDTEISGDITFEKSVFSEEVNFTRAKFTERSYADFYKVDFVSAVTFQGAEFWEQTSPRQKNDRKTNLDFTEATFHKTVNFKDVILGKRLFLRNTTFKERCDFRGVEYGDYIDFIGSEFHHSLLFSPKHLYEKDTEPQKLISDSGFGLVSRNEFPVPQVGNKKEDLVDLLVEHRVLSSIVGNHRYVIFREDIEQPELCEFNRNNHRCEEKYDCLYTPGDKKNKCLESGNCLGTYVNEVLEENKYIPANKDQKRSVLRNVSFIFGRSKEYKKINTHAANRLCAKMGLYDSENYFWYWYKVYGRYEKKHSIKKAIEVASIDWGTKYFTSPMRILKCILGIILLFSLSYTLYEEKLCFSAVTIPNATYLAKTFLEKTYFSAITFTTIGYRDIPPSNLFEKIFAPLEGAMGVLVMSAIILALGRKYLR